MLFLLETSLLAHIKFKDGFIVDIYEADGGNLWDGVAIDPNKPLLTDVRRNEVFTYYNCYIIIDKHKEIKVRGLKFPSPVTQMKTDQGT